MIKLYYTFKEYDSDTFITECVKRFCGKDEFVIKRTKNKKPYIRGKVFFSLSHTHGMTVCAVSDRNIGVDAEKIHSINNKEKILLRFLKKQVVKADDAEFYKEWTAFESRVKFFGERISSCPKALSKETHVTMFTIGEYIISVCSLNAEIIQKERI